MTASKSIRRTIRAAVPYRPKLLFSHNLYFGTLQPNPARTHRPRRPDIRIQDNFVFGAEPADQSNSTERHTARHRSTRIQPSPANSKGLLQQLALFIFTFSFLSPSFLRACMLEFPRHFVYRTLLLDSPLLIPF